MRPTFRSSVRSTRFSARSLPSAKAIKPRCVNSRKRSSAKAASPASNCVATTVHNYWHLIFTASFLWSKAERTSTLVESSLSIVIWHCLLPRHRPTDTFQAGDYSGHVVSRRLGYYSCEVKTKLPCHLFSQVSAFVAGSARPRSRKLHNRQRAMAKPAKPPTRAPVAAVAQTSSANARIVSLLRPVFVTIAVPCK